MKRIFAVLLFSALPALAQISNPSVIYGVAPAGSCVAAPPIQIVTSSGAIWTCANGTWAAATSGGSPGTVTSVTGTANQIDVATGTTTPVISLDPSLILPTGTTLVAPVLGTPASGVITNLTGTCTACTANASTTAQVVPAWLQYYGDGSEGALNVTSGTTNITPGEHWFSTCNVSAGANLAVVTSTTLAQTALIIRCTGTMTLAGTVSYSFNTASSSGVTGIGNYTGGGGGGGFGAANGAAGAGGFLAALGAGTAGTSGVSGGNGTVAPAQVQKMLISGMYSPGGAVQCGGSSGGLGGSSGGTGGRGGGCVIIVAPTFNFTGTCDVSGVNGGAGGSNTGGGGGGSGGACIFRSPAMTNSGAFTLTAGAAGTIGSGTSTAGGAGAAGFSKVFTQ